MNRKEIIAAIEAADALAKSWKYNKVQTYFRDTGPNARSNYPKHMELMEATKNHRICAFIGGNGTGKSLFLAIVAYYHLSGKYPKWWTGHKFTAPIDAWLCARETKALREGIQEILFGSLSDIGTGIIPKDDLQDDKGNIQTWAMAGTANCVGMMMVKHHTNGVFDGYSKCEFKTYAQGWAEFQGPTRQFIGFDEEPDDVKIFAECLARLRGKDGRPPGHFLASFTPTHGFSDTYLSFVPDGVFPYDGKHPKDPQKFTMQVTWDDVPHLDEDWKASCLENWKLSDPNNIEARKSGIAAMGSGRVYPIDESFVVVPKFKIPNYWPKAYGMDPGQANFAVIWITQDPDTGVMYIYDEYKHGKVVYLLHAEAIKTRGDWIHGGIDPHEAVKPRDSGETVQSYFETQGLHLVAAKGDPDATRAKIRALYEAGSLKIMDSCTNLIKEVRTYRYDQNDPNKIARNQEDHLCDAKAYAICVFEQVATSYAEIEEEQYNYRHRDGDRDDSERSKITGY